MGTRHSPSLSSHRYLSFSHRRHRVRWFRAARETCHRTRTACSASRIPIFRPGARVGRFRYKQGVCMLDYLDDSAYYLLRRERNRQSLRRSQVPYLSSAGTGSGLFVRIENFRNAELLVVTNAVSGTRCGMLPKELLCLRSQYSLRGSQRWLGIFNLCSHSSACALPQSIGLEVDENLTFPSWV